MDYDDGQLQKFDCIPPYPSCLLPSNDRTRLLDALHGYQLHQQCNYEDNRLQWYNTQLADVFIWEVHTELLTYLQKWESCGIALEGMDLGAGFDMMLAQDMQQWIAHRSHSLFIDLEALHIGSDRILCEYANRWS